MIKDIVSFNIAGNKFAIDFQKTPLILTASKYLPFANNLNDIKFINFENHQVKMVYVHDYLHLPFEGISEDSKILVGELEEKMYGLIVDRVIEIITITNDFKILTIENGNEIISGEIVVSNEKIPLVDTYLLLKQINSKRNITNSNISQH